MSLEIDVILIGKINSSLDFILDIFVNISNEKMNSNKNFLQHKYFFDLKKLNFKLHFRIIILEYIYNVLTMSRCNPILEKLKKYNFFEEIWVKIKN